MIGYVSGNNGSVKMEIVAEIGWNFLGEMSLAQRMIEDAKDSGATTAKFQYWTEKKLKPGPWDSDGRREIYQNAQLTETDLNQLQKICKIVGIEFLISCFNAEDAEYLRSLGVTKIKIPSHEVANVKLHTYCAKNFLKSYVSLGAGSYQELQSAAAIYNQLNSDWVGMHCVSSYPCPLEKINLPKLTSLNDFVKTLGLSDHTSDVITPALSIPYGVQVIEKHFTSDNDLPGRDNKFALNPEKFQEMVTLIKSALSANTDHGLNASPLEADTIKNYRGRWG